MDNFYNTIIIGGGVGGLIAGSVLEDALILEKIAKMALGSLLIEPTLKSLPQHICIKHHQRKHGSEAYYGQK